MLGGYDLAKYAKGPIQWHKVGVDHTWYVQWNSVSFGDQTLESFAPTVTLVDTGTSYITLP